MKKYTVIIMEDGEQIITKKVYPEDKSGNEYWTIIGKNYPKYKTTLEYLEFDKLVKFISMNWGLNDKQYEILKEWKDSEEMVISFNDLIKTPYV